MRYIYSPPNSKDDRFDNLKRTRTRSIFDCPISLAAKLRCLLALLVFSSFTITLSDASFAQPCTPPSPSIIAWWPLDEAEGTDVADIAGNNPGMRVNGPISELGIVGNALRFDGSNDYVAVADSDLWAFGTNDFTIELWASFDAPGGSIAHPGDVLISTDEGSGTRNKWFFALGGGRLYFLISDYVSYHFFPLVPFSPNIGEWYHLAVRRSGDMFTIFINGVPEGEEADTRSIPNVNAPLLLGQSGEPFGGYLNGRLDEVSIYNAALSDEEIEAIFNAGSSGKCKLLKIVTPAVSAAQIDEPFSQDLEAINGDPPYSWSIVDGLLPEGISLSSGGTISGIPTIAGTHNFTVQVTDNAASMAEKTYTQEVFITLPPPVLRIEKSGTTPVPGRTLEYFALVENLGAVSAVDVPLTEFIEPWFRFVSAYPAPNDSTSGPDLFPDPESGDSYNALIHWTLPVIHPGEVKIVSYTVDFDPSFPLGETVNGRMCLTPDEAAECRDGLLQCLAAATVGCIATPQNCLTLVLACEAAWATCIALKTFDCGTAEGESTGPLDPNEKLVIANRYIQPDQTLVYPIYFENVGPVEAIDVFVTDELDPNLDISTLQVLTPDGSSFDHASRTLRWDLLGRNLQPGETDNVQFSIKPMPSLPSGTEIRNQAKIRFEVIDSLLTNEVVSIIDAIPPIGTMNPLPEEGPSVFEISWAGTDAIGEIDVYSILVSTNGGGFEPFLMATPDTSATFSGTLGETYGFICLATDLAGNVENQEVLTETQTTVTTVTSVLDPETQPAVTALYEAAPNPFNPITKIRFSLANVQAVRLDVYSVDGHKVATLVNETMSAGQHEVFWTGRDNLGRSAASGIYFYRLQAGDFSDTKRMMLLK